MQFLFFVLLVCPFWTVHAEGISRYETLPGQTKITYHVEHKFHNVDGVSSEALGKAVLEGFQLKVQYRVPLKSFDSGSENRDTKMLAITDAAHTPFVEFKGEGTLCKEGLHGCHLLLVGTLDFHGVQKEQKVGIDILKDSKNENVFQCQGSFSILLDDFKVEKPSLFFIALDNEVKISIHSMIKGSS